MTSYMRAMTCGSRAQWWRGVHGKRMLWDVWAPRNAGDSIAFVRAGYTNTNINKVACGFIYVGVD